MVSDLADPKNALCGKSEVAALESKQLGNQCFLKGDYMKALDCYTKVPSSLTTLSNLYSVNRYGFCIRFSP